SAGGKHARWDALEDGEVYVWDVPTWKKRATLQGLKGRIVALAFSPDSKTLAVGDESASARETGSVKLYTPGQPTPRKTLSVQEGGVRHLSYSPRDSSLLVVTNSGWVALWDPGSETQLRG